MEKEKAQWVVLGTISPSFLQDFTAGSKNAFLATLATFSMAGKVRRQGQTGQSDGKGN